MVAEKPGFLVQPPSLTSSATFGKALRLSGSLSTQMFEKQIGISGLRIRFFFSDFAVIESCK